MAERLTRADVDRIATLARLELSDAERELFVHQLSHVLEYAEQIQRIDTTGVPPTSHVLSRISTARADPSTSSGSSRAASRDDEPRPSLTIEDTLANAPDGDEHAGLFRVPRVL